MASSLDLRNKLDFGSVQQEKGRLKLPPKLGGFDPSEMMSKIEEATEKMITPYRDQIQLCKDQTLPAIDAIYKKTLDLYKAIQPLSNYVGLDSTVPNVFSHKKSEVHSSNGLRDFDFLIVTPGHEAKSGNPFQVQINKLAEYDQLKSNTAITGISALNVSGSLVLNGKTINIIESDSLKDIQKKIENSNAVHVSVIDAGQENFYLMIGAKETGKALALSGDASILEKLCLQAQEGTMDKNLKAKITLNGIEIIRDTNTIMDTGLKGITLDLKQAAPGAIFKVNIEPDKGQVVKTIEQFVHAYNELSDEMANHTKIDQKTHKPKEEAYLYGNELLRTLKSILAPILSCATESPLRTLSDLGLEIGTFNNEKFDGKIQMDTEKIGNMVVDKFDDVLKLFGNSYQITSSNFFVGTLPQGMHANGKEIKITYDGSHATMSYAFQKENGQTDTYTTTQEIVKNHLIIGKDHLRGLQIGYSGPENYPAETTLSFTKGIAQQLSEVLSKHLSSKKKLSDPPSNIFEIASDQVHQKHKSSQERIDAIQERTKVLITATERKMNRVYAARNKAQKILDQVEALNNMLRGE